MDDLNRDFRLIFTPRTQFCSELDIPLMVVSRSLTERRCPRVAERFSAKEDRLERLSELPGHGTVDDEVPDAVEDDESFKLGPVLHVRHGVYDRRVSPQSQDDKSWSGFCDDETHHDEDQHLGGPALLREQMVVMVVVTHWREGEVVAVAVAVVVVAVVSDAVLEKPFPPLVGLLDVHDEEDGEHGQDDTREDLEEHHQYRGQVLHHVVVSRIFIVVEPVHLDVTLRHAGLSHDLEGGVLGYTHDYHHHRHREHDEFSSGSGELVHAEGMQTHEHVLDQRQGHGQPQVGGVAGVPQEVAGQGCHTEGVRLATLEVFRHEEAAVDVPVGGVHAVGAQLHQVDAGQGGEDQVARRLHVWACQDDDVDDAAHHPQDTARDS